MRPTRLATGSYCAQNACEVKAYHAAGSLHGKASEQAREVGLMRIETDAVQLRDSSSWRDWLVVGGLFIGLAATAAWCGIILASSWWLYAHLAA